MIACQMQKKIPKAWVKFHEKESSYFIVFCNDAI